MDASADAMDASADVLGNCALHSLRSCLAVWVPARVWLQVWVWVWVRERICARVRAGVRARAR
eukprot:6081988-Alexandrium_andersonii.AAC.1